MHLAHGTLLAPGSSTGAGLGLLGMWRSSGHRDSRLSSGVELVEIMGRYCTECRCRLGQQSISKRLIVLGDEGYHLRREPLWASSVVSALGIVSLWEDGEGWKSRTSSRTSRHLCHWPIQIQCLHQLLGLSPITTAWASLRVHS